MLDDQNFQNIEFQPENVTFSIGGPLLEFKIWAPLAVNLSQVSIFSVILKKSFQNLAFKSSDSMFTCSCFSREISWILWYWPAGLWLESYKSWVTQVSTFFIKLSSRTTSSLVTNRRLLANRLLSLVNTKFVCCSGCVKEYGHASRFFWDRQTSQKVS